MATKMQHCAWCGEELGVYENWYGEPESCGKRECDREIRYELAIREKGERDEARYQQ